MVYNASKNTSIWIKNNPEKHQKNLCKSKDLKEKSHQESLRSIKKSKYKTPMQAVKGYCRKECKLGESRNGHNYINAYVTCHHKSCPLFAFRNGDPRWIKRGLKKDMTVLRKARKVG